MDDAEHVGFSLVRGGPLYRLLERSRVVGPGRRSATRAALAFVAATWIPFTLMALAERSGLAASLVRDPSVHVRLLLGIPCCLFADALFDERCTFAVDRFAEGKLAAERDRAQVSRIARWGERLGDRSIVEAIFLALAFAGGLQALSTGASGYVRSGGGDSSASAAYQWYALVALPAYQYFYVRTLWHWVIWSLVLWRLSRLDLRLMATHPDRSGGLGHLVDPTIGLGVFAFGLSAVLATAWGRSSGWSRAELSVHAVTVIGLILLLLTVAFGPLLSFSHHMYRDRLEAFRQYSLLSLSVTRWFHRRWVEQPPDASVLERADVSVLCDLDDAYAHLQQMRVYPFGVRAVLPLIYAFLIPMGVLVASLIPADELIRTIAKILFGVLPHAG
jgi:hypothetical protein